MSHHCCHHHCECEHELRCCKCCGVVYCTKCGQEWTKKWMWTCTYPQWTYTISSSSTAGYCTHSE